MLNSEQISNGFGSEGIGGGDMDSYNAFVNYLDRVKAENLQGASCLMSLNYESPKGS
ncbi:hypothetical protein [Pedomonas sp. V897]|uniref:hypothetical protein n=1 Tax=Pedomonas sp. V897 TaxID=3446482 RepID=UPI003EE19868